MADNVILYKKLTINSAFSATHTYIKLTLVSFFLLFFYAPSLKTKTKTNVRSEFRRRKIYANCELFTIFATQNISTFKCNETQSHFY